ncbi:MAG: ABC transporter permease subunit [Saprospiraceae bacterium]|nr:ABC transporter permease subunit [Saprospiraceae bacterium]
MSSPLVTNALWRRFRRNAAAVAGLLFLGFAVFIALFAYLLAPDGTPNANNQVPELALLPPGSRVPVLQVRSNTETPVAGFFEKMLFGAELPYKIIPLAETNVFTEGDSLRFRRYGSNLWEKIPGSSLYHATWERRETGHPQGGNVDVERRETGHPQGDSDVSERRETGHPQGENVDVERRETGHPQGAPLQTPNSKLRTPISELQSPNSELRTPNSNLRTPNSELRTFPLGTDRYGRCMLSRLLLGFRVSLGVGALAVVVSLSLGLFLGLISAYFGGRVDHLVMLLINTVWSIPTLLLVFAVVMALGRGIGIIFLAVGLTMWVEVARVVRGQVMQLRSMPFVEAAQSMGLGSWRVVFRHILPNLLGPVLVLTAGNFATAILLESGLSYLGFGVQPPAPSWGSLLNENYGYALSGRPILAVAPALVIALSVLAFNLVGNGLRDALDVKMK